MPDDKSVFGEVGDTDVGEVSDRTVSPAEEQATGQEDQTQDQDLPFHEHPRWKEVYGKAQQVDALKQELENLKNQLTQVQGKPKEEDWQPKTWQEVLQRSVDATLSRLQQYQGQQQAQTQAEDKALADSLAELKGRVGEFDERKLLEFCYNNKLGDVSVGYELMKKVEIAEKKGEKTALRKKVAPVGSSAKTEGGAKQDTPYKAIHKQSLDDIVSDAVEQLG